MSALANGTNSVSNGDVANLNGSASNAGVKIKNKAALKRSKQKKAKLEAASRESSVVRLPLLLVWMHAQFLSFKGPIGSSKQRH